MNEQIVRDLGRHYGGTAVEILHHPSNKKMPVFIRNIEWAGGQGHILYISLEGTKTETLNNVEILEKPASAVFDYHGRTFVYKQRPERQWRRGICHDNSLIVCPFDHTISHFDCEDYRTNWEDENLFGPEALQNLFNPTIRTLKDALLKIETDNLLSLTVNQKYFISRYTDEGSYVLWRMGKPLGKFIPEKRTMSLFDPLYQQEVVDFFNRQGVHYVVV